MSSQTGDELPPSFDTLRVGIALYDPESKRILDANDRLVSVLGYDAGRLRTLSVGRYTANTGRFSESEFEERLRACAT